MEVRIGKCWGVCNYYTIHSLNLSSEASLFVESAEVETVARTYCRLICKDRRCCGGRLRTYLQAVPRQLRGTLCAAQCYRKKRQDTVQEQSHVSYRSRYERAKSPRAWPLENKRSYTRRERGCSPHTRRGVGDRSKVKNCSRPSVQHHGRSSGLIADRSKSYDGLAET